MTIPYGAKLCELETTNQANVVSLLAPVRAGTLLCLNVNGKRAGALLNVVSVQDSQGNAWEVHAFQSQYRASIIAWTRTAAAMTTEDTIAVTLNGEPRYCWISGHGFEGASNVPIDRSSGSGNNGTASVNLKVAGSDWLVYGAIILPDATAGGLAMLNSGLSRDDNAHAGVSPWCECFSRNGTSGTTYTAGATLPSAQQWGMYAVSFPFLAMPASPARAIQMPTGI